VLLIIRDHEFPFSTESADVHRLSLFQVTVTLLSFPK
jgi:hypothetical protein